MPAAASASAGHAGLAVRLHGETLLLDPSGAIFAPASATVLIADLHFGKSQALAARGLFLPPYDSAETMARLKRVIDRHQPRRVICLGDSFHTDAVQAQLPQSFFDTLAALADGRDWVWITGNHDPGVGQNLPGQNLSGNAVAEMPLGAVTLRHIPQFVAGQPEIAGHLHPGARIVQRGRSLRRRCFAVSDDHIVLPAFGTLTGALNMRDKAFDAFHACRNARAVLLGQDDVFPMSASRCVPD
jgi:uncharacterized protein